MGKTSVKINMELKNPTESGCYLTDAMPAAGWDFVWAFEQDDGWHVCPHSAFFDRTVDGKRHYMMEDVSPADNPKLWSPRFDLGDWLKKAIERMGGCNLGC